MSGNDDKAKNAGETPAEAAQDAPAAAAGEAVADDPTGGAKLPLLYKTPRPLSTERHADKSLAARADYRFAAEATAIPINTVEFSMAVKHYPIVFTPDSPPVPVAVVGLKQGTNLFVGADGAWRPHTYVPAYVRRYPFIFMTGPDQLQYALCIDEASDLIVDGTERPFFEDGKPTQLTQDALKFCSAFQGLFEATREFGAALAEHDLLVENRADIKLKSGDRMQLGGFRVIDEGRFNALPGDTFLEWREKGWLPLVYAAFASASNWSLLVDIYAEEG